MRERPRQVHASRVLAQDVTLGRPPAVNDGVGLSARAQQPVRGANGRKRALGA